MTETISTNQNQPAGKAMKVGLWVAQALLALIFLMAGFTKAFTPVEELTKMMTWVASFPNLPPYIGTVEILGALGVVLPSAVRIQPRLAVFAAGGLLLIQVLAAALHLYLGELNMIPINLTLGALAAFVLWGRAVRAPIVAR